MSTVATLVPSSVDFNAVKEPAELVELAPQASPYDFDQMFSVAKMGDRRLGRLKIKQLRKLDAVIRSVLRPGERVFYLFDGIKNSWTEQYFLGWIVYYYNHHAFVFTPERIILIHLEGKKALGKFVGQIDYCDISELKVSGMSGSVSMKFYNGKKFNFAGISKQDRKFIKEIVSPIVEGNTSAPGQPRDIINLCPQCYTEVADAHASNCPDCTCAFKTPKSAAIRSLILPGLGDMYLGAWHGIIEIMFMGIMWLSMFAMIGEASSGESFESPQYGYEEFAPTTWEDVGIFAIVLLAIHIGDAFKTLHVAKKGIFPKENIKRIRERMVEA